MSTKILNAYRFDGNLHTLLDWLKRRREAYKKHLLRWFASVLKPGRYYEVVMTVKECSGVMEASAVVYSRRRQLYVQFFGLSCKLLPGKRDKAFADWHYQSSTDRPEHISAAEWRQRRDCWDKLIGGGTPVEAGLTFKFYPPLFEYEIAEYIKGQAREGK